MGLDMYLSKKTFIWGRDEHKLEILLDGKPFPGVNIEKVSYIEEEVGYWRKANAIHQWFVEEVQDGEDNCGTCWVSLAKLQELLDTVNEVLESFELIDGQVSDGYTFDEKGEKVYFFSPGKVVKDPTVAQELLPTQEGFFFGGTDYDEWYYRDLEETKKILENILDNPGEMAEYYYHSSW